ncbi:hypothetical protein [Halochromatium salexigens]|uniref:hypothetical protein n=1 Tax=Halochromatium salexigens TaxID=49447 RepID=UPI001911C1B2|nr:hypothetical protein [Halochromatium salexigens]
MNTYGNKRINLFAHEAASVSSLFFFLSIFLPLLIIYGLTAHWTLPYDPDAMSNVVASWHLGNTGSVISHGYEDFTSTPNHGAIVSFVDSPNGPVSKYPPGAAMLPAPLYALEPSQLLPVTITNASRPEVGSINFLLPALWPATLSCVLATAAAIGFVGISFLQIGSPRDAWIAAMIAGLGTSAWSVASAELFQHGPAMLWIALSVYLSSQQRYWAAGLSFGAAILTRPLTAVIPAIVGFGIGVYGRSFFPILRIGLASSLGVLFLLLYNLLVFDALSITGGYGDGITQGLEAFDIWSYLITIIGGLFDPFQGFLVLSPFFLLLIPGLLPAWRQTPPWVRVSALGGLVYLLMQFKLNRYNPANTTLYRYPLEALTVSAPLWFAAYRFWLKDAGPTWRRLWPKAVVLAIGIQGIGVWII